MDNSNNENNDKNNFGSHGTVLRFQTGNASSWQPHRH